VPFSIVTYSTLGTIVNTVAKAVGYATSVADPAGSTDPAVGQMVYAVNAAAKELVGEYPDQFLIRQASLTVVADTPGQVEKAYPLPADFFRFVDQTQNDVTARLPSWGPIGSMAWQSIKALTPFVTFELMWRVVEDQIVFLNPPSSAHTFTYEYLSQGYITDADDVTLYKNEATKNGDVVLIDEFLVTQLARVKWLEIKGFDSGIAQADYMRAFNARVGRKDGAAILSTAGRPINGGRLLDALNVPSIGYGL
jgi:hypothetical protein